jgi:hypothetical protein
MGSDPPFVFLKTVEILATQIQDQTPPLCSENDGDSGGADPGSDPPLNFQGGGDRDDTYHGHSGTVGSTGKDLNISFGFPFPFPPPLPIPAGKKCLFVDWQSNCPNGHATAMSQPRPHREGAGELAGGFNSILNSNAN